MSKSIKWLIVTALFISFAFICVFTNPTKDEYISWAKETSSASFNSKDATLSEMLSHFLNTSLIGQATKSKNYVFFTIFETDLDNKELKVVGALDNFFPVSSADSTGN